MIAAGRLLVVIPSPGFGGAERQTAQVVRGLLLSGLRVTVAAEAAVLAAAGEAFGAAAQVPLALHQDSERLVAEAMARQAAALRPLLRAAPPEAALVCCPLPTAAFGALEALSTARVPTLALAHLARGDWHTSAAERAAAAALRVGWAAISEVTARRLEAMLGLPRGRVAAVPNGLPPASLAARDRARFGLPEGVPVIVQVGRLDHRKGAGLAPALAARIAPGIVALAGEGPLAPLLGAAPGVRLLGHVTDVPALLAAADALLMATEHEGGVPLALQEAARAGLPILATRQALEAWPAPEAVARIVPREAGAIAAAFAALRADPAGTAARVAAARAAIAAWDEDAMVARTAQLLAAELAACAA
ncbi:MAG: glycosyltransferase [Rubritepida sp.]|nr:glycosyltransferase [Rubritepida sp.]